MLFLSEKLKWFVKRNLKGILLGDLNTNSIKSKLDQIKGNVDIMIIFETKFDESSANGQFRVPRYAFNFRLDRNQFGHSNMVFIGENIPHRLLSLNKSTDALFQQTFVRETSSVYDSNKLTISDRLDLLRRSLDSYFTEYKKIIIIGNFNTEVTRTFMKLSMKI